MSHFVMFGLFSELVANIFTVLNTTIYKFVGWLYQIFMYIAGARLFSSNQIEPLVHRIQLIIGVVMLFIAAFSLIKSIINPDKEAANTSSLLKNCIITLVMLTLVNTVFNYLYEGQRILMKNNVIGKIILGSNVETECALENAGFCMATDTLAAFFDEDVGLAIEKGECYDQNRVKIDKDDKEQILKIQKGEDYCYYAAGDGVYASKKEIINYVKTTNNMTKGFLMFSDPYDEGAIDYSWFLALIAGCYLVYIFLSFCFDMAIRVAKLAVLQIIAPIAIISKIIPNQDSIFNNWIKKTLTSFLEVFIKIAIIFFGIYLILLLDDIGNYSGGYFDEISGSAKAVANIMITLGILMFVKQAPGFISEIFGINSGNMKLGIKDKFSGMVGAGAVGAVAGAATGYMGGAIASKRNGGSFFRGGLSGAHNGFKGKGNQWKNQATRAYQSATGDYKSKVNAFGTKTVGQKIDDSVKNSDKKNKQMQKQNRMERAEQFQQMQSKYDALHNTDAYNQRIENFEDNNQEYAQEFNNAMNSEEVNVKARKTLIDFSKKNPYATETERNKVLNEAKQKFAKEHVQNQLKTKINENKINPNTGLSYKDEHPEVNQYVNDINVKVDIDESLGDTKKFDKEYNEMKTQVNKDQEISKRLGEEENRKKAKQNLEDYFKDIGLNPNDKNNK